MTGWTHKLTHLYNVVIKQQPEIVTFHNGNVMSPVWTAASKNNTSKVEQSRVTCTLISTVLPSQIQQ